MSFLERGRILCGRYRVETHLGGGGMADVYRVWDELRSCRLAIKVLRANLAEDPAFLRRFQREADALARLQHPNIIRLYGLERVEQTVFLVMDFVEGRTLAARLAEGAGPLPLAETREIMRDLCAALAYAHRMGLLHRDVKPANVLLSQGRAWLSDFGIAKAVDTLTLTAFPIGTPAYMSPEQCQGREAEACSDIYSLGILLFELLAGRRPFLGERAPHPPGSTRAIFHEHVHAPVPSLLEFNPGLSAGLQDIVERALSKQPGLRYADADALWQAFDRATQQVVTRTLAVDASRSASVYVDGMYRGKGPQQVDVAVGPHAVRIVSPGSDPVDSEVVVDVLDRTPALPLPRISGGGTVAASHVMSGQLRSLLMTRALLVMLLLTAIGAAAYGVWTATGPANGGATSASPAPGSTGAEDGASSRERAVSAGGEYACALDRGAVACWGNNDSGQTRSPSGSFKQLSAGANHACALSTDARLSCWGSNDSGQSSPPTDAFLQVSAGANHSCGLQVDGTLRCWGEDRSGQSTPPRGSFTQVSAGSNHTCAIGVDRTVTCWGDNSDGQASAPDGDFLQISAGGLHSCGIRGDGTVACWGNNDQGQSAPSTGIFSQVSAGGFHSCGIRTDGGTLACWGFNGNNRATPPAGMFRQVSAGWGQTCAVKTNGALECWGEDGNGQATPPEIMSHGPRPRQQGAGSTPRHASVSARLPDRRSISAAAVTRRT